MAENGVVIFQTALEVTDSSGSSEDDDGDADAGADDSGDDQETKDSGKVNRRRRKRQRPPPPSPKKKQPRTSSVVVNEHNDVQNNNNGEDEGGEDEGGEDEGEEGEEREEGVEGEGEGRGKKQPPLPESKTGSSSSIETDNESSSSGGSDNDDDDDDDDDEYGGGHNTDLDEAYIVIFNSGGAKTSSAGRGKLGTKVSSKVSSGTPAASALLSKAEEARLKKKEKAAQRFAQQTQNAHLKKLAKAKKPAREQYFMRNLVGVRDTDHTDAYYLGCVQATLFNILSRRGYKNDKWPAHPPSPVEFEAQHKHLTRSQLSMTVRQDVLSSGIWKPGIAARSNHFGPCVVRFIPFPLSLDKLMKVLEAIPKTIFHAILVFRARQTDQTQSELNTYARNNAEIAQKRASALELARSAARQKRSRNRNRNRSGSRSRKKKNNKEEEEQDVEMKHADSGGGGGDGDGDGDDDDEKDDVDIDADIEDVAKFYRRSLKELYLKTFTEDELYIDITNPRMEDMPRYRLIRPDLAAELKRHWTNTSWAATPLRNGDVSEPHLLSTDIMVRIHDFLLGDLVLEDVLGTPRLCVVTADKDRRVHNNLKLLLKNKQPAMGIA